MDEKFPLGYEIEPYMEKALEELKKTYPWATRELFDDYYSFAVEEENGGRVCVCYCGSGDTPDRYVPGDNADILVEKIAEYNSAEIERANPVDKIFTVPLNSGIDAHGWTLESYRFRSHTLGGYSACVTAGDRDAGGSRIFFIPPDYFEGSFDEFLDKYCKLVPARGFGLDKEYLKNTEGLSGFLGFETADQMNGRRALTDI